jgi:hypothetical protein
MRLPCQLVGALVGFILGWIPMLRHGPLPGRHHFLAAATVDEAAIEE